MKLWQASSFSPMGPVFLICTWLGLEAAGLICFQTIQIHSGYFRTTHLGSVSFFLNDFFVSRPWLWYQSWPTNIAFGTQLHKDGHLHFLWTTDRHLYTVRRLATPPWSTRWPNDPVLQRAVACSRKSSSIKGYFIYSSICILTAAENHWNYSYHQEP